METHKKFGSIIRTKRLEQGTSLRRLAQALGVSPTYLSKIERGQELPPKEDRIQQLAKLLDLDFDSLIASAGRVPDEVAEIYLQQPIEVMALLRTHKKLRS